MYGNPNARPMRDRCGLNYSAHHLFGPQPSEREDRPHLVGDVGNRLCELGLLAAQVPQADRRLGASGGFQERFVRKSKSVLLSLFGLFLISRPACAWFYEGHEVVAIAVSADQAVQLAERERPDVVLMDIRLAGPRDGVDAALEIRSRLGERLRASTTTAIPRPSCGGRPPAVRLRPR